jgi:hypothetical protein
MLEPTHAEIIQEALRSKLADVHTAIPGRVVSYDKTKQVADVEIVVKRPLETADGTIVQEDLPVIPNVPIVWSGGGGISLTFPLAEGDHVLLVFCEASIAMWRETGEVGEVGDLRRHSLGHAVAIPMVRPVSEAISSNGVSDSNAVLYGGVLQVGGPTAGFVALASLVDTAINSIIHAFNTHVHGSSSGPTPTISGTSNSAASKLKSE